MDFGRIYRRLDQGSRKIMTLKTELNSEVRRKIEWRIGFSHIRINLRVRRSRIISDQGRRGCGGQGTVDRDGKYPGSLISKCTCLLEARDELFDEVPGRRSLDTIPDIDSELPESAQPKMATRNFADLHGCPGRRRGMASRRTDTDTITCFV